MAILGLAESLGVEDVREGLFSGDLFCSGVDMKKLITVLTIAFLVLPTGAVAQQKPNKEKAKDPVCEVMVEKDPALSHKHNNEMYYFCSRADMEKFKKDPSKYTKKK